MAARFRSLTIILVVIWAGGGPASAQSLSTAGSVELGGHLTMLRLTEFDITDTGFGVNAAWHAGRRFAIDGTLSWFPGGDSTRASRVETQSRLLGLIGVRSGVRHGAVEVSAHGRTGFLKFNQVDNAVCIAVAVFPLPLDCRVAAGYTAFAMNVGGGLSFAATERVGLRIDVGDLIVRYGQESFRRRGERTNGFFSHNLLASGGAVVRF